MLIVARIVLATVHAIAVLGAMSAGADLLERHRQKKEELKSQR